MVIGLVPLNVMELFALLSTQSAMPSVAPLVGAVMFMVGTRSR